MILLVFLCVLVLSLIQIKLNYRIVTIVSSSLLFLIQSYAVGVDLAGPFFVFPDFLKSTFLVQRSALLMATIINLAVLIISVVKKEVSERLQLDSLLILNLGLVLKSDALLAFLLFFLLKLSILKRGEHMDISSALVFVCLFFGVHVEEYHFVFWIFAGISLCHITFRILVKDVNFDIYLVLSVLVYLKVGFNEHIPFFSYLFFLLTAAIHLMIVYQVPFLNGLSKGLVEKLVRFNPLIQFDLDKKFIRYKNLYRPVYVKVGSMSAEFVFTVFLCTLMLGVLWLMYLH